MGAAKFTLDPKNLPELTEEQSARLNAMTDEEITAAALADPDSPPMTDDELRRFRAARLAKRAREKQGMSQVEFARTYHISHGRLRDIEQGRGVREDTALVAYLRVIEESPETVQRALKDL
jgi:putative transcriptional regulator